MNLGQIFANAIARRVAYVLVAAVLAWCGMGRAEASQASNVYATREAALTQCQADKAYRIGFGETISTNPQFNCSVASILYSGGTNYWYGCARPVAGCAPSGTNGGQDPKYIFNMASQCPAGSIWNDATGKCEVDCGANGWPDPTQPGQCLNADKCKAKPALGNSFTTGSVSGTACVGGCEFAPELSVCTGSGAGALCSVAGAKGTGLKCPSGTPAPTAPKAQECKPAVAGQTMCIKPNGDHCHTASTGRQICWKPGETGTKTDGANLQKRDAGNTEIPPNVNLPNGDTLVKDGTSATNTTTVKNNVTNTATTINTITSNYRTQNGTDAGGSEPGDGEPGDGSGGGEGDGDDDKGSATGGEACGSPPVMTGDPVLAMAARQAYLIRCGSSLSDANGDGLPDYLATDGLNNDHGESAVDGKSAWADDDGETPTLDETGFGLGRSCPSPPTITIGGQSRTIDTSALCDLAGIIAALVYLIALAHAAYIFGGNR